jgi:hypothetical protein
MVIVKSCWGEVNGVFMDRKCENMIQTAEIRLQKTL